MTLHQPSTYVQDDDKLDSEIMQYFADENCVITEMTGGGPEEHHDIASGTIIPGNEEGCFIELGGEGNTADTLQHIDVTNCRNGHVLWLRPESASEPITIDDQAGGSGQIKTMDGADIILTDPRQFIGVKLKGTTWEVFVVSENINVFPASGVAQYQLLGRQTGSTGKPTYGDLAYAHIDKNSLLHKLPGYSTPGTLQIGVTNSPTDTFTAKPIASTGALIQLSPNFGNVGALKFLDYTNLPEGSIAILTAAVGKLITVAHASAGGTGSQGNFSLSGGLPAVLVGDTVLVVGRVGNQWKEIARGGFADTASSQPNLQGGRLSPSSSDPVALRNSGGNSTAQLWFVPFRHNRISFYDSQNAKFVPRTFSPIAITPTLIANTCCGITDLYASWNGSAVVINQQAAAKSVVATSSPTAGTGKVISVPDTTGVVYGHYVAVTDGSHSEIAQVTAVNSVSITVDSLANAYTLPTVTYLNVRSSAAAQTQLEGVTVLSSDNTQRFIGTILWGTTSGAATAPFAITESSVLRGIWNQDNQIPRPLYNCGGLGTYTYATTTWRATAGAGSGVSGNGLNVGFIAGGRTQVSARFNAVGSGSGAAAHSAIALVRNDLPANVDSPEDDERTVGLQNLFKAVHLSASASGIYTSGVSQLDDQATSFGLQILQACEKGISGTMLWHQADFANETTGSVSGTIWA